MAGGLGGSGFKAQLLQSPSAVATGAGWSPASQPSMSCAVAYHHFRIRACAGRNESELHVAAAVSRHQRVWAPDVAASVTVRSLGG